MLKVIIDENLPRSFTKIFKDNNFQVLDVRDFGLRGASDSLVFNFTKEYSALLATSDVSFAQWAHFFVEHNGIFLIRFPSTLSLSLRCKELDIALKKLRKQKLTNKIAVISVGLLRIHGKAVD